MQAVITAAGKSKIFRLLSDTKTHKFQAYLIGVSLIR
jgi:hypothetical protein